MVEFGNSLPQTSVDSALATIVDPTKNPVTLVHDVDKGNVTLYMYSNGKWVASKDMDTGIHFSKYDTKTAADTAVTSKKPNDLVYVSGDKTLYYVDSTNHLVPIVTVDLSTKQDDVGFALADIDGDGNDDVYNKRGHKLMLTDSSGHVIPLAHEGQAVAKKHLDAVVGALASLLTTNKGDIVSAINELFQQGTKLNADIQAKLKHLTSAEHIVEYNTGNPTDPSDVTAALAKVTNPTEGDKVLLIDKTAGKARLDIYHDTR